MTLVVAVPDGYGAERRYALDVVLSEWLGLDWRLVHHAGPGVRITLADDTSDPAGCVTLPDGLFATAEDDWLTPTALPPADVPWVPVGTTFEGPLRADDRLPVLHGAPAADPPSRLVTADDGVHLHVDVLGGVFFLITRYEELLDAPRDRYDRFPAAASVAERAGFHGLPLADAYVELLWAALQRAWPRLTRTPSSYQVLITHDVDDPLATLGRTPALTARQLAADLVHRRDPGLAARRARAVLTVRRGDHGPDVNNTFDFLMDVSERHGLRSAFYFLSHNEVRAGAPPCHVLGHPWVRDLVGHVHRRGHEVGLHAGFGTYRDPERTRSELTALRAIADEQGVRQEVWGGRQHYLQWGGPVTWRNWEAAGLDYDCTLGWADRIGFRTGTCREYPVFDLEERKPLRLRERPFQVMDVTLAGYLGLTPDAAMDAVLAVARECRRFQGTLGVLWHNDEVLRTGREKRWYADLVAAVTAAG
ncbi:polysaccharide deacetylase family protein [Pseudonocardia aurantiaca]|uniref:Polysaccharide deacetylase family protein n=1 Tax=Pseudonocardia aurantiaca TaxID=75290 RepID=A0ABW4FUB4_9PSEU